MKHGKTVEISVIQDQAKVGYRVLVMVDGYETRRLFNRDEGGDHRGEDAVAWSWAETEARDIAARLERNGWKVSRGRRGDDATE